MGKTHYRNVFKSDHLGVADLEDMIEKGIRLVFTIKEVKQHMIVPNDKNSGVMVAGNRISANIAYFVENIKPMVIKSKNSKTLKKLYGSSWIEEWKELLIELYIDPSVKYAGEITGGVRINPKQPTAIKPEITPESPKWAAAVDNYKKNQNMAGITKHYSVSEANQKLLIDAAKI